MLLALCLGACAPLNGVVDRPFSGGYRLGSLTSDADRADRVFIGVALSGGGTRAAAFAYGALQALHTTRIGAGRSMLDEVDVISSASGGSFTSAYYGLFRKRTFDDFEQRMLRQNFHARIGKRFLYPWNMLRLASPYYSRIDLASEVYDAGVFDGRTIGDMHDAGRPLIVLNATDLDAGARIDFTQRTFDLLGSDVRRFPVARAVAASSAFPGLLSALTIANHAPPNFPSKESLETYRDAALRANVTDTLAFGRYSWGRSRLRYVDEQASRPYVHLADGGIVDNLGLGWFIENARWPGGYILQREEKFRLLALIVINAGTEVGSSLSKCRATPGVVSTLYKTASNPTDVISRGLLADVQTALKDVVREADEEAEEASDDDVPSRLLVIHLSFHHVDDRCDRERLLSMGTNFHLTDEDVALAVRAGRQLASHPTYRHLRQRVRALR